MRCWCHPAACFSTLSFVYHARPWGLWAESGEFRLHADFADELMRIEDVWSTSVCFSTLGEWRAE